MTWECALLDHRQGMWADHLLHDPVGLQAAEMRFRRIRDLCKQHATDPFRPVQNIGAVRKFLDDTALMIAHLPEGKRRTLMTLWGEIDELARRIAPAPTGELDA